MNAKKIVFVVHHTYGESDSETYKLIGVFDTENSALDAIKILSLKPGFCDYVNGFSVEAYTLNESGWAEGFGTNQMDHISTH
ncbi:hypothetical protein [Undibacterium sp.]|uniref:DUF7336 domain-containing protein n=1 Tax=Undibacterium sp. TaxID=1914977 RepID=UPI00374DF1A1